MVQTSAVPQSDRSTINARPPEASKCLSKLNIDSFKRGTLLLYDNEAERINQELQLLFESGGIEMKFQFMRVTKCMDSTRTWLSTNIQEIKKPNDLPIVAQAMRRVIKSILDWKSPREKEIEMKKQDDPNYVVESEDQIFSLAVDWPPSENHHMFSSYSSQITPMPKPLSKIALEINSSSIPSAVLSEIFYLLNSDLSFFPMGSAAWCHRHEASVYLLGYLSDLSNELQIDLDPNCVAVSRKRRKFSKKEEPEWNGGQQTVPMKTESVMNNALSTSNNVLASKLVNDNLKTPADTPLLLDLQKLFGDLTMDDHSALYDEFQTRAEWSFVDPETCELNHKATTQGVVREMINWCRLRLDKGR